MNEQILLYIALALAAVCVILLIILVSRQSAMTREMNQIRKETQESIQFSLKTFGDTISTNQRDSAAAMDNRLADLNHRFSNMAVENEQKLENIRNTMERKITDLTSDNNKQLEQMRQTVDEKLQKTLEDRIGQSFKLVSERLEQVYKGLGAVSYTHLRAHETGRNLVCRLLLEKKKKKKLSMKSYADNTGHHRTQLHNEHP